MINVIIIIINGAFSWKITWLEVFIRLISLPPAGFAVCSMAEHSMFRVKCECSFNTVADTGLLLFTVVWNFSGFDAERQCVVFRERTVIHPDTEDDSIFLKYIRWTRFIYSREKFGASHTQKKASESLPKGWTDLSTLLLNKFKCDSSWSASLFWDVARVAREDTVLWSLCV